MNPDALLVKLCDILNNISETQSANQARNYILIMDGLLSNPPPAWNKTHADIAAQSSRPTGKTGRRNNNPVFNTVSIPRRITGMVSRSHA